MGFWEGAPYLSLGSLKEMEIYSGLQSSGTYPTSLALKRVLLLGTQAQEELQRPRGGPRCKL